MIRVKFLFSNSKALVHNINEDTQLYKKNSISLSKCSSTTLLKLSTTRTRSSSFRRPRWLRCSTNKLKQSWPCLLWIKQICLYLETLNNLLSHLVGDMSAVWHCQQPRRLYLGNVQKLLLLLRLKFHNLRL